MAAHSRPIVCSELSRHQLKCDDRDRVLLARTLADIERCKRSVVNEISVNQRILSRNLQDKLQRIRPRSAPVTLYTDSPSRLHKQSGINVTKNPDSKSICAVHAANSETGYRRPEVTRDVIKVSSCSKCRSGTELPYRSISTKNSCQCQAIIHTKAFKMMDPDFVRKALQLRDMRAAYIANNRKHKAASTRSSSQEQDDSSPEQPGFDDVDSVTGDDIEALDEGRRSIKVNNFLGKSTVHVTHRRSKTLASRGCTFTYRCSTASARSTQQRHLQRHCCSRVSDDGKLLSAAERSAALNLSFRKRMDTLCKRIQHLKVDDSAVVDYYRISMINY